ncbi:MAG: ABC transporter ATP-binding protein [Candidatus Thorarchaeota archaeon]
MSANAIEAKDLTRRYGYRIALREVTFDFSVGGIHGLFGANGAGKTTFMRIVSTLLRPHGGTISIFGNDPEEDPLEVRRHLGLVGDKPLLYQELTGRENLRFYGGLYSLEKEFQEKRIAEISERFDVKKWLDEPTKILSTGLRKRLDIVRSLLHNPPMLLLDEPFSGLDKDSTAVFREYLEEIRSDHTILLTTHNLSLGAEICDDFVTLRKGRVLSQGPASEFDGVI